MNIIGFHSFGVSFQFAVRSTSRMTISLGSYHTNTCPHKQPFPAESQWKENQCEKSKVPFHKCLWAQGTV